MDHLSQFENNITALFFFIISFLDFC